MGFRKQFILVLSVLFLLMLPNYVLSTNDMEYQVIGHWNFDSSTGNTSADIFKDMSGFGYDLTNVSVDIGTGYTKEAGSFSTPSYAFGGAIYNFVASSMTMCLMFKTADIADNSAYLLVNDVGDGMNIRTYNSRIPTGVSGGVAYDCGPALTANKWYATCVVYNGTGGESDLKVWTNRTMYGGADTNCTQYAGAWAGAAAHINFSLGTTLRTEIDQTPEGFYDGMIDEVTIWNRSLSDEEAEMWYDNVTAHVPFPWADVSAPSGMEYQNITTNITNGTTLYTIGNLSGHIGVKIESWNRTTDWVVLYENGTLMDNITVVNNTYNNFNLTNLSFGRNLYQFNSSFNSTALYELIIQVPIYTNSTLTSELIGGYNFDASTGNTSAGIYNDLSPYDFDLVNSTANVAGGVINEGIYFDGNDYVYGGDIHNFSSSDLTICHMFNATNIAVNNQYMVDTGMGTGFASRTYDNFAVAGITGAVIYNCGNLNSNQWYSICIVYNKSVANISDQLQLWVDNTQYKENNCTGTVGNFTSFTGNTNFSLGAVMRTDGAAIENYFTGSMDELYIWNRSLSNLEINQWFDNTSAGLSYPWAYVSGILAPANPPTVQTIETNITNNSNINSSISYGYIGAKIVSGNLSSDWAALYENGILIANITVFNNTFNNYNLSTFSPGNNSYEFVSTYATTGILYFNIISYFNTLTCYGDSNTADGHVTPTTSNCYYVTDHLRTTFPEYAGMVMDNAGWGGTCVADYPACNPMGFLPEVAPNLTRNNSRILIYQTQMLDAYHFDGTYQRFEDNYSAGLQYFRENMFNTTLIIGSYIGILAADVTPLEYGEFGAITQEQAIIWEYPYVQLLYAMNFVNYFQGDQEHLTEAGMRFLNQTYIPVILDPDAYTMTRDRFDIYHSCYNRITILNVSVQGNTMNCLKATNNDWLVLKNITNSSFYALRVDKPFQMNITEKYAPNRIYQISYNETPAFNITSTGAGDLLYMNFSAMADTLINFTLMGIKPPNIWQVNITSTVFQHNSTLEGQCIINDSLYNDTNLTVEMAVFEDTSLLSYSNINSSSVTTDWNVWANESIDTGSGTWNVAFPLPNVYDDDITTAIVCTNTFINCSMNITFEKPNFVLEANYTIIGHLSDEGINKTAKIPDSCFDLYDNKIVFRAYSRSAAVYQSAVSCRNSTGWQVLLNNTDPGAEGITHSIVSEINITTIRSTINYSGSAGANSYNYTYYNDNLIFTDNTNVLLSCRACNPTICTSWENSSSLFFDWQAWQNITTNITNNSLVNTVQTSLGYIGAKYESWNENSLWAVLYENSSAIHNITLYNNTWNSFNVTNLSYPGNNSYQINTSYNSTALYWLKIKKLIPFNNVTTNVTNGSRINISNIGYIGVSVSSYNEASSWAALYENGSLITNITVYNGTYNSFNISNFSLGNNLYQINTTYNSTPLYLLRIRNVTYFDITEVDIRPTTVYTNTSITGECLVNTSSSYLDDISLSMTLFNNDTIVDYVFKDYETNLSYSYGLEQYLHNVTDTGSWTVMFHWATEAYDNNTGTWANCQAGANDCWISFSYAHDGFSDVLFSFTGINGTSVGYIPNDCMGIYPGEIRVHGFSDMQPAIFESSFYCKNGTGSGLGNLLMLINLSNDGNNDYARIYEMELYSVNSSSYINQTTTVDGLLNFTMHNTSTALYEHYDNLELMCIVDNYYSVETLNTSTTPVLNYNTTLNNSIPNRTISLDEILSIQVNCSDADNDTIKYYDNTTLFDIGELTGLISDSPTEADGGLHIINITCGDKTTNASTIFNYTVITNAIDYINITPTYTLETDDLNCHFNVSGSPLAVTNVTISWWNSTNNTAFESLSSYDYTFVNITTDLLYNTTIGTGSVPAADVHNYTYWKCEANISYLTFYNETNTTVFAVHPLETLNIISPANETISTQPLNASFTVIDYDNNINCSLNVNGTATLNESVQNGTISNISYTPPADGIYDWNITCVADGGRESIASSIYRYTYDSSIPTFSNPFNYTNATYPAIGNNVSLNITVDNSIVNISVCKLQIYDDGIAWTNVSTFDINSDGSFMLDYMSYIVQPEVAANDQIVNWSVWCNLSTGAVGVSDVYWFNIVDIALPVIDVSSTGNNWATDNLTVITPNLYNLTWNFSFFDYNLFQTEVNITCDVNGTIHLYQNLNVTTSFWDNATNTTNLTNLPPQRCFIHTSASDDHTDNNIPDYVITSLSKGIKVKTENNNIIDIIDNNLEVTDAITTQKSNDRYSFDFGYDKKRIVLDYTIKADHKIYYRSQSEYMGHFVVWNEQTKTGNWIDFENNIFKKNDVEITKINDYEFNIKIVPDIRDKDLPPEFVKGVDDIFDFDFDTASNAADLLQKYGIKDIKFKSIGGTVVYNATWLFYTGGYVNISTLNLFDNGTYVDNFSLTITAVNSYPGLNGTWNITGNAERLENLTNGTYLFQYSHIPQQYLNLTRAYEISELNQSDVYNTSQSQINVIARSFKISADLTFVNLTAIDNVTGLTIYGHSGAERVARVYLNTSGYNLTIAVPDHDALNDTINLTFLDNITLIYNMSFIVTFSLYDEKIPAQPFDINSPSSVVFKLICPDSTHNTNVTTVSQSIPITCDYIKFRFVLNWDYLDNGVYFRTYIFDSGTWNDTFNISIYLIDLNTTAAVANSFILDDLLQDYDNPRIYIKKRIGETYAQITADFIDIENKVTTFLIQYDEYILELYSDNNPVKVMGPYNADSAGEKNMRVYEITLESSPVSAVNDVTHWAGEENISNSTFAHLYYSDANNNTNFVTFNIFKDQYNGTLLFSVTHTGNYSYDLLYNVSSYVNDTLYYEILYNYEGRGTFNTVYQHTGVDVFGINLEILDYITNTDYIIWFITILLSILAIMSTVKSANIMTIVLLGMSALFIIFGWYPLAWSIWAIIFFIAIINIMKKGEKNI